nr:unnamed protein product [Callosobruchus analis]
MTKIRHSLKVGNLKAAMYYFEEVNFNRRANNKNNESLVVPPIRETSKSISSKKYKYLMSLLDWVPPIL